MDHQNYIPAAPDKTCAVCGKQDSPLRTGLCQPCYRRNARYGSTEYKREGIEDLTLDFVLSQCVESRTCLLWTGPVSKEGRPQTLDRKHWREEGKTRQILLHRWMHEHERGDPLRKGQQVKQTCGNKRCVAPEHLHFKDDPELLRSAIKYLEKHLVTAAADGRSVVVSCD